MGWELPKELVLFLLLSWERWWEAGSDANRVLSVPAHTERTAVTVCPLSRAAEAQVGVHAESAWPSQTCQPLHQVAYPYFLFDIIT